MNKLFGKAAYVVRQPGNGKHTCHWPGCSVICPPAMWGCKSHWQKIPAPLQRAIWASYVPGQEISKTPSRAYVKAARAIEDWIAENVPAVAPLPATGDLFNV